MLSRSNIITHVLRPQARHPLLWYYWFEVALSKLLSTIQADVFFSPDGYCSLKTNVPTVMTIHDLAYLHFPKGSQTSHRYFLKRYLPKYIERAESITCVSAFTQTDMAKHFPHAKEKSTVIHNGVTSDFKPLSKNEIIAYRKRISDGQPYFLYLGSIHPRKNVSRLIEAYNQFRKTNNYDIQLVLAGRMAWKSTEVKNAIDQSAFKSSIRVIDTLRESIPTIVGAAYAMCYPSLFEGFGLPVLEAMACGVPVVTSSNSAMSEVCNKNVIYVDPVDVSSIVSGLEQVFENDTERMIMSNDGIKRAQLFSWQKTAEKIYPLLEKQAKSPK